MLCRHLDGNPHNNRLDNIVWGTVVENEADKVRHGTRKARKAPEPIMFFDPFIPVEAIVPWEVWKEPFGHPGYEVSNHARARSYWTRGSRPRIGSRAQLLSRPIGTHGYPVCGFRADGCSGKKFLIHRLVLETFSPQADPTLVCRHLDGVKTNCLLSNLRWGTESENSRDRVFHGTTIKGENHHWAKLTWREVRAIRKRLAAGHRQCDLARKYRVCSGTISLIDRNLIWVEPSG